MLYGDYHTHTTYSHGTGSILENVRAAAALGIREIAITDHGFRHMFHGVRRKKLSEIKSEIEKAQAEFPDIKVLLGIESDITGRGGTMDLTETERKNFDLILCGYHVAVWGETLREQVGFLARNQLSHIFSSYSKAQTKANTRAYVETIKKNPVAVLTHINFRIRADVVEVAKAARDAGTFIEISGKRTGCADDEIAAMAQTGVQFVLNSDAHSAARIGDVKFALDIVERVGIPYEQIANWDKRPKFREV